MPKVQESEENKGEDLNPKMDESTSKMFKEMQQKIADLEKKSSAPQALTTTDSNAQLIKMLLKKNLSEGEKDKVMSNFGGYSSMDNLDLDDVLPEKDKVVFMSPCSIYVIVDGFIGGKAVMTPYRTPIVFKYLATRKVVNGKDTDIFNYSTYTCKSKKELEFLTNHHLYGAMFYKQGANGNEVNSKTALKIVAVMNGLKSVGGHDLLGMCKARGIEPGQDVQKMRIAIAVHDAAKIESQEESLTQTILRNSEIENQLTK